MTINRNNFEAHLLDYLEGNLDPLLTADLMAFLTENPEYESYIPEYDTRISLNGNHEYNQKDRLKKDFADLPEITSGNFDEFCIATCEGLLDDADRKRLSDFVATHPEKKQELDLYARLKLQPDISVVFTQKARLKKNAPFAFNSRIIYYALGVAASLALLLMLISKKPAESVYTQAPEKKETILPVVPSDQNISVQVSEEYLTPKTHAPVKNYAKAVPAEEHVPMIRETAAEDVVFLPLKSIGTQEIIAESLSAAPDLPRIAGNNRSYAESEEFAGTDPLSSEDNQGLLRNLISKVDFWKTAEKAIQGFNYLTEASLDIDKTLDENGRLSGILLNMDSYRISGNKIK